MGTNKAPAALTKRRQRRSSAEVRSRIQSAAVAVFAERGYGNATTREIACRAEVAEPVIFRIYPTKQALFDAAVLQPFEEFISAYMTRWLAAPAPGGNPEEVLQQFVEELHDLVRQNRQLVAALASSGSLTVRTQPVLAKLEKMGTVIAETHGLVFDPKLSVRIAAVMVVAVTLLEDELFDGTGNRLVAEMVRMLVGAARYIPSSNGCT